MPKQARTQQNRVWRYSGQGRRESCRLATVSCIPGGAATVNQAPLCSLLLFSCWSLLLLVDNATRSVPGLHVILSLAMLYPAGVHAGPVAVCLPFPMERARGVHEERGLEVQLPCGRGWTSQRGIR